MSKTGKRIPISDAKEIGNKHGYSQVIIVAWDGETSTTSVCTWGKSLKDCEQAAEGGNFVKKALGWPDEKCNDIPLRIKQKTNKIKSICNKCKDKDQNNIGNMYICDTCGNEVN